tara:strand:+ start:691 stop:1350 length:660 start_codon:yes stop_codon:yes gene_type:complete
MRKLINNKKGVSGVVTTVLLILLIVAAIGLIWSFLRPTIEAGVGQVSSVCLTLDIRPVECSTEINKVAVKRFAGDGVVKEVSFVFDESTGGSYTYTSDNLDRIPDLLEQKFLVTTAETHFKDNALADTISDETVSVSVRVKAENELGELIDCPVGASSSITCNELAYCGDANVDSGEACDEGGSDNIAEDDTNIATDDCIAAFKLDGFTPSALACSRKV